MLAAEIFGSHLAFKPPFPFPYSASLKRSLPRPRDESEGRKGLSFRNFIVSLLSLPSFRMQIAFETDPPSAHSATSNTTVPRPC